MFKDYLWILIVKMKTHPQVPFIFLLSGPVVLKVWSGPLTVDKTLSQGHHVKLIFMITLRFFFCHFHFVDICPDGAKVMVGKAAGSLACAEAAVTVLAVVIKSLV